jgi:hypothetical protein
MHGHTKLKWNGRRQFELICRRRVNPALTCVPRDVQDCCRTASTPSAALTFTVQMDSLSYLQDPLCASSDTAPAAVSRTLWQTAKGASRVTLYGSVSQTKETHRPTQSDDVIHHSTTFQSARTFARRYLLKTIKKEKHKYILACNCSVSEMSLHLRKHVTSIFLLKYMFGFHLVPYVVNSCICWVCTPDSL